MTVQATSLRAMGESESRINTNAKMSYTYSVGDSKSVAVRLRKLREATGLSRPKFAALLGDTPMTTLKNYELFYRETGLGILLEVARVFGPEALVWVMTGQGKLDEPEVARRASLVKLTHIVG